MNMMEITTNRQIDTTILQVVKTGFEEQKNISVLSL